jgi:hypothetical protein
MDVDEWVEHWEALSPEERVREQAADLAYRSPRRVADILAEMLDRLAERGCLGEGPRDAARRERKAA